MFVPDQDIDVNYYLVKKGSKLDESLRNYSAQCEKYCADVEKVIEKYGADSAMQVANVFNYEVHALNFAKNASPLFNWKRDSFGSYFPYWSNKEAADDMSKLQVAYLNAATPEFIEGTRYAHLGEHIVAACTPNKDGSVTIVDGAEQITEAELEDLKAAAPQEDRDTFQLNRSNWMPQAMLKSPAFKTSDAVRDEKRQWWDDNFHASGGISFKNELETSLAGRAVRWLARQL